MQENSDRQVADKEQEATPTPEPQNVAPAPIAPPSPFEYETDTPSAPPEPAPPNPAARPHPKKDPETGRFLPKEKVAPKPSHPRSLLRLGADLGFTREEMAEMSTDDLTEQVAEAARDERVRALSARNVVQQPFLGNELQRTRDPEPEPDDLAGLHPEIDPSISSVLRKMQARINAQDKEIRELKGGHEKVKGSLEATAQAAQNDQIDSAFNSLGPDYEDVFGQGTLLDFDDGDPRLQKRKAVLASLRSDPPTRKMSLRQAIVARAKSLFGSNPPPRATGAGSPSTESAPAYSQEEWNEGALQRPTHRARGPQQNGVKKAEASVAEILQASRQTMPPETYDEDFLGSRG